MKRNNNISTPRFYNFPWLAILISFSLIFFCYLFVEKFAHVQALKSQQIDTLNYLSTARARLEGEVNSNLFLVRGLIADIAVHPDIDQKHFAKLAKELFRGRAALRNIGGAPDLIISLMYPLEGNQTALGLNYNTHPQQREAALKVIETGKIVIAGPLNLVQGGTGFIARAPVFIDDDSGKRQLWGLVSTVMDEQKLYQQAGLLEPNQNFTIAIRGKDAKGEAGGVFFGNQEVFQVSDVQADILLPYGSWRIAAMPVQGWVNTHPQVVYIRLFFIIISLLLGITFYFAIQRNNERNKAHIRLQELANYDPLTSLANRRLFSDRIQRAIALTERSKNLLAVCYLDLDGFKEINDSHGHAIGDKILKEIALRLQDVIRIEDTVARWGGDEFALLLGQQSSSDECATALERVLSTLSQPYLINEQQFILSASIGVTVYPHDHSDSDTLLRHADQAMYQAKQLGGNCYRFFDPEEDRRVHVHHEHLLRISEAIENNELLLYYQPKVDMLKRQIIGVEALVRWQHPEQGILAPIHFLPLIKGSTIQYALDWWVINFALQQAQQWHKSGVSLSVSINVSPNTVLRENFVSKLEQLIKSCPDLKANDIELEILETDAPENIDNLVEVIKQCSAIGVDFALDDYGTGYSSLTYIRRLPVDILKIDQSFIRDMLEDNDDLHIVKGVIGLAAAFNRDVIAEGVETIQHGSLLIELGCNKAQGYGIAKPMPAEELPDWINSYTFPPEWT